VVVWDSFRRSADGRPGAPQGVWTWHSLEAFGCEAVRRLPEAVYHFDRLIAAAPEDARMHARRGWVCARLGRWDAAVSGLLPAAGWRTSPSWRGWMVPPRMAGRLATRTSIGHVYPPAVDCRDRPPGAGDAVARLFTVPRGMTGGAAAAGEAGGEHNPRSATHWDTVGMAAYRAGAWREAVAAFEKATQLTSPRDTAERLFFLGMAVVTGSANRPGVRTSRRNAGEAAGNLRDPPPSPGRGGRFAPRRRPRRPAAALSPPHTFVPATCFRIVGQASRLFLAAGKQDASFYEKRSPELALTAFEEGMSAEPPGSSRRSGRPPDLRVADRFTFRTLRAVRSARKPEPPSTRRAIPSARPDARFARAVVRRKVSWHRRCRYRLPRSC
jgi:tetratricopeptide (TPR) repeat protein